MYEHHEKSTVWWPRPNLSNPRSINDIVWAFSRANPISFWVVTNRALTKPKAHGQILKRAANPPVSPSFTPYRHPQILHVAPPLLNQASTFMCTIKNPPSKSLQIIRPTFSSEAKAKGGHNGNGIWVCREFMMFNIYVFKRYISFLAFSCVWMIQYLCV